MSNTKLSEALLRDPGFLKDLEEIINKRIPKEKAVLEFSLEEIKDVLFEKIKGERWDKDNYKRSVAYFGFNTTSEDNDLVELYDYISKTEKDYLLYNSDQETSQKETERMILFNKLMKVRDFLRQGWTPDWTSNENKCCLDLEKECFTLEDYTSVHCHFSFQSKKEAEKFLELMKTDLERFYELSN